MWIFTIGECRGVNVRSLYGKPFSLIVPDGKILPAIHFNLNVVLDNGDLLCQRLRCFDMEDDVPICPLYALAKFFLVLNPLISRFSVPSHIAPLFFSCMV